MNTDPVRWALFRTRRNDSGQLMASLAGRLSAADITAVNAYFSNLAP